MWKYNALMHEGFSNEDLSMHSDLKATETEEEENKHKEAKLEETAEIKPEEEKPKEEAKPEAKPLVTKIEKSKGNCT